MEKIPLLQDIPFRSALFAITIRSPVPRGRLLSITCPPMERSYTLITAKDIPGKNKLADFPVPILASEELSYLGEPAALLVGPDRAKLALYARQCAVIVQEEPPVFAAPASILPAEDPAGAEPPGAPPEEDPGNQDTALPEAAPPAAASPEAAPPTTKPPEAEPPDAAPPTAKPPAATPSGDEPAAAAPPNAGPPAAEPPTGTPPDTGAKGPAANIPAAADRPQEREAEVFAERNLTRGKAEAAFAKAARIVSGVYTTGIQEHCCAEAVGALVEYISADAGRPARKDLPPAQAIFVIHTPTQWPYHVSRSAAAVLGVEAGQIVTESTDTGIPMDGRLWYPSLIACQTALASYLTRRNVRLILNREEDFRFSPKRNASVIQIHSALGEKGEILGTRVELTVDLGAQAVFAQEIVDQCCLGVLGIAGPGALELKARAVKTNIPPQGPYGGFGGAQGSYAMERHHSLIADTLGLDPAEWRKNNRYGKQGPWGIALPGEAPPVEQLLDTTAAMSDYYRKWASYELLRRRRRQEPPPGLPETRRGIGIALGWQGNGPLYTGSTTGGEYGEYGVEATLNMDGSLEIHTSIRARDDFIAIWSNIARETLGVEEDKVRIISQNTALSLDSGPACFSRKVTTISTLIDQCCQTIRNQRFRDPLPITVRKTCQPEGPAAGELRGFSLPAGMILDAGSLRRPGWGAAVVEIEIEPHSYTPLIRGIWLGIDGGKILSEDRARRSLKIAAIQALGWASREYLGYRAGGIDADQISGYGIPNPGEIPPIHIDFLWNDTVAPKGIGELPFGCIPAAYIQAVSQAADHPFDQIPQKPDHIWEILRPPEEGAGPAKEADS